MEKEKTSSDSFLENNTDILPQHRTFKLSLPTKGGLVSFSVVFKASELTINAERVLKQIKEIPHLVAVLERVWNNLDARSLGRGKWTCDDQTTFEAVTTALKAVRS